VTRQLTDSRSVGTASSILSNSRGSAEVVLPMVDAAAGSGAHEIGSSLWSSCEAAGPTDFCAVLVACVSGKSRLPYRTRVAGIEGRGCGDGAAKEPELVRTSAMGTEVAVLLSITRSSGCDRVRATSRPRRSAPPLDRYPAARQRWGAHV
jgi:hypothetical protein